MYLSELNVSSRTFVLTLRIPYVLADEGASKGESCFACLAVFFFITLE